MNKFKANNFFLILGKLSFVLFIVFCFFYMLEMTARHVFKKTPSLAHYTYSAYHPRPYVMSVANLSQPGVNKLGYKGKLPSLYKAKGEYRIFVLGGSTIFLGNYPIPVLLQQKFKQKGLNNVKVYNFGSQSSLAIQDLVRVVIDIFQYSPDLIVMYGGGNDLTDGLDPRPGYPMLFRFMERNPLFVDKIKNYKSIPLILYNSLILRILLKGYFTKIFVGTDELNKMHITQSSTSMGRLKIKHYLDSLKKSSVIASGMNANFISFFQPLLEYKKIKHDNEKIMHMDLTMIQRRKQFYKIFTKSPPKFKFVDLSSLFDRSNQQLYDDRVHPNKIGNQKIADKMFGYLYQNYLAHQKRE